MAASASIARSSDGLVCLAAARKRYRAHRESRDADIRSRAAQRRQAPPGAGGPRNSVRARDFRGHGLARSPESKSPPPQRSCPLPQDRLRLVAGSCSSVGGAGAHSTGAIHPVEPLLVPTARIVALRGHVPPSGMFNFQNTHARRGQEEGGCPPPTPLAANRLVLVPRGPRAPSCVETMWGRFRSFETPTHDFRFLPAGALAPSRSEA